MLTPGDVVVMGNLTLASDYVKRLFASGKVVRYVTQRHADAYAALQKIVESSGLD
jgi:hypothetical protein